MTAIRVPSKVDPYIVDWLSNIRCLDDCMFEYNERSYFILQSLMNINCVMDKIASLRIEDLNKKALEYKCETRTLRQVLSFMELDVDTYPKRSKKYMNTLYELARLLNLKELSDTNYMLAFINLRTEANKVSGMKFELNQRIYNTFSRQILNGFTYSTLSTLPRISAVWAESIVELENAKKYTILKKKIKSMGMGGKFTHKAILSCVKAKDNVVSNTASLKCRLTEFRNLPLSLNQMNSKITHMRYMKTILEREFEEVLNGMG